MVDPLSILGAVGVVVALSVSIIKIVKAAKNAGKEREEWVKTLVMVKRYLTKLNSRLEQARKQAEIDRSESWYRELSEAMSGEKDSPRSLLESKLRDIEVKFAPRDGLRHHERVRRGFHLAIKGEVIEMFSRVNELLSDLQDAFEIDQLDRLIDRTTTMHALQVEAKQRDLSRQIRDGLERLSNLDFAKTQNQIYGACYKGRQNSPGQWFINSQEFNAWRTGLVQTLYCVGEPGAGKTVLSSIVIENLEQFRTQQATPEQLAVAYLYLDYKETQSHSLSDVLGSILQQLLRGRTAKTLCAPAQAF